MKSELVFKECEENEWKNILQKLPGSHFLQSSAWAQIKADIGWKPFYKIWLNQQGNIVAGAMILERKISVFGIPVNYGIHYVPKGPLLDWKNEYLADRVLDDLESFSKSRKSIFLKIDPDLIEAEGIPGESDFSINKNGKAILHKLTARKWIYSENQIQFKNTVWIDLNLEEAELLAGMKQKTRYNIRLANRKGVKIRKASTTDFPMLFEMYVDTALRDNFTIRSKNYYLNVWNTFYDNDQCEAFIAEYENTPIAGLFLFYFGEKAYYVYGMSTGINRNLMPTYLLQWEAIKAAKRRNKAIYDLWGAPFKFNENDSMWGVFKFKQGLGGKVIHTIGAWDYPVNKFVFWLYLKFLPKILGIFRVVSKRKLISSNQDNFE